MIIFVNDIEIRVFAGARVIDAVRAYYAEIGRAIPHKTPIAKDRYGNTVAIDGRLSEGNHIYIKIKTKRDESTKN